MELSARNQIRGRVTSVTLGTVMAEIAIEIGAGQTIVSTISLASVERMKIRVGRRRDRDHQGDRSPGREVTDRRGYFFLLVFQVPVSTTFPLYRVSKLPDNASPTLRPVIREEALWPFTSKS